MFGGDVCARDAVGSCQINQDNQDAKSKPKSKFVANRKNDPKGIPKGVSTKNNNMNVAKGDSAS